MADTLAWVLMSWLLPAAGCAFFVFVIVGCSWLTVYMVAEIIDRVKMILRKRGDS